MVTTGQLPQYVWRLLSALTILLLLITISGIALISAGVFDPKPIGTLQQTLDLNSFGVAPDGDQIIWQIETIHQEAFSLRLRAAWRSGEDDVGYGLAIGNRTNQLVIGLSPLGYATVQYRDSSMAENSPASPPFPWQTWPHINSGQDSNEIWIDVMQEEIISIRINGEILTQENLVLPDRGVGLWLESFGKGANISFEDLRIYFAETGS